jgi:O-antigen/teichoic acid export membrane protein
VNEEIGIDARRGWRLMLRRFAALSAGEGAARLVGFAVVLVLARRLQPDGFGVVTLGLTLVAWFAFVVDSGTELLNVREIARRPAQFNDIAEQVLGLRLALSVVSVGIFIAGVELFARSAFTRDSVVLFALLLPAIALNLRWMVLGVGGAKAVAAGNVAGRIVVLAGALVFVLDIHDLKRVPLLEFSAELTYALIVLWLVGGRLGSVRPRADLALWWSTLRQSLPLMVSGVARATIVSFDVIVISVALGPHDLGIYGVASKPVAFAAGAVGLFSLSFLSAFSATAEDEAAALHGRALFASAAACVALSGALTLAAPLLPIVFGDRYSSGVPVLAIIAWRIPLAAFGGIYASILVATDQRHALMWNSVVAAIVVIAMDIAAVLTFGLIGAAIASIASAGLFLALNHRSVVRATPALGARAVGRARRSATAADPS